MPAAAALQTGVFQVPLFRALAVQIEYSRRVGIKIGAHIQKRNVYVTPSEETVTTGILDRLLDQTRHVLQLYQGVVIFALPNLA